MTPFPDAIVAFFFAVVLNAILLHRISAVLEPDEHKPLTRIFLASLALRYAIAVFLNFYALDSQFALTFWGDSGTYDFGGQLLVLRWRGEYLINQHVADPVSGYGFHYFVGALYYVFGTNQLLVQFVNGTIGALSIIVIYLIAKMLFDKQAARWAALFMAFFPQMIFWSGAMYKDPSVLLCIAVCMYAVLQLNRGMSLRHLLLFAGAGLILMTLRFYVFYIVAFATLGTFLFSQRRGVFGSVAGQIVLVSVFVGALWLGVRKETIDQQAEYFSLSRLQIARSDQAMWGRSAYGAEINVSTPSGALAALPVGVVYLLFAPFPWALRSMRQIFTLPEMLVWYALMPSLVRGLRYTIRDRLRPALPILVFTVMLTLAYAVFQSNVGTAYRQRTQIAMFFFIFMGAGLAPARAREEGLDLVEAPSLSSP